MLINKNYNSYLWDLKRFGLSPQKIFNRAISKKLNPIILISSPKSGTHLVEQMLCQIPQIYRPVIKTLNSRNHLKYGGYLERLKNLKHNQLLVTHMHYDKEISESKAFINKNLCKILLQRQPQSIVVSYIFYIKKMKSHPMHHIFKDLNLRNSLNEALKIDENGSNLMLDNILKFKKWEKIKSINSIYFEDLVSQDIEKKKAIFSKILKDININESEDLFNRIFFGFDSSLSTTFRSGKVDDWKNYLSKSQEDFILNYLESKNG